MEKVAQRYQEDVPVDRLRPHPLNANEGARETIAESLEENGFYGAVYAHESTGYIIAGKHRWEEAQKAGADTLPVIWLDVDERRATKILAVDNESNRKGRNDDTRLAALLESFEGDFVGTGYGVEDLDVLLRELGDGSSSGTGGDPDALPDAPGRVVSQPGDVWLLGDHAVHCVDSFEAPLPSCDALISDPPYGKNVDTSWFGGKDGKTLGGGRVISSEYSHIGEVDWDSAPFDPLPFAAHSATVALFGANYFCTLLPEVGTWWVWDKRTMANGEAQDGIGMPFELIWLKGQRKHHIVRHLWVGFIRKAEDADRQRLHPTQKPVGLMRELVEYLTKPGEVVLDPFAGSGTTLIAAHQAGRVCVLMERDPAYVDVTCRRFQKFTGTLPVLERTGEAHDFTQ